MAITLSAADQAATGWGPTFDLTTWNSFINELYARVDLPLRE